MKEIILIDGKMLAYRAHYAHLALKNEDGEATGLLHGFLYELLSINKKLPEAPMIICWDGAGKTWRHALYPKYKANRVENPEWQTMREQIAVLLPMLKTLGFHVFQIYGVEADDLIGILSCDLNFEQIRIYSGDRDMYQLVRDGVCVWPKFDKPIIRTKDVEKWLGAPMEALVEIKAMAGDPTDNLKGLPGVGFVTARKLWKEGLRLHDVSNGKHWAKYSVHWRRLKVEYQLAQIICSTDDEVWTEVQREDLKKMVLRADTSPHRKQQYAMEHRDEFYKFLGHYGLKQLFSERQRILSLP
jgi:DNA polymerase I